MTIVSNPSLHLAVAVEENLRAWVLAQAESVPGVELHQDPGVTWIFTTAPAPGNTVMSARFADKNEAVRRATKILDYHLVRGASSHWTIGPATTPVDLGPAVLRPLGYSCRIHCAGMHCDLTRDVPAQLPVKSAVGVDVRIESERPLFEPVTTERRRRQKAIAHGMGTRQPQRIWYFGAWLDGKAVGRTTLFAPEPADSPAGIYDVEVLKHARYRGIGSMLVYAALRHAISLGRTECVLAATGAGKGVYERTGFREVTRISFWMYGKMRQQ